MIHKLRGVATTREVWLDGKFLDPAKSQKILNHSPDGFNWGYGGSGPAQLALAILLELEGEDKAIIDYQDFKWNFIATLSQGEDFETEFSIQDHD